MFVYSGLPWTTIRNECTKWRRWLDSDEAKALSTDNYSSSSCRHIVKQLTLTTTQLPHQTVFIQLKMMERGTAINPLKMT